MLRSIEVSDMRGFWREAEASPVATSGPKKASADIGLLFPKKYRKCAKHGDVVAARQAVQSRYGLCGKSRVAVATACAKVMGVPKAQGRQECSWVIHQFLDWVKSQLKPEVSKAPKRKQRPHFVPYGQKADSFGLSDADKESLRIAGIPKLGAPHPDYRKDDSFYVSTAWKQLRYLALRNANGACQCCGARAADGATLHVDHVQSRYKAPHLALSIDNLQILCGECNVGKGAWDSTDWRPA